MIQLTFKVSYRRSDKYPCAEASKLSQLFVDDCDYIPVRRLRYANFDYSKQYNVVVIPFDCRRYCPKYVLRARHGRNHRDPGMKARNVVLYLF